MAIRGIGRRPDRPVDIGEDLDRIEGRPRAEPAPGAPTPVPAVDAGGARRRGRVAPGIATAGTEAPGPTAAPVAKPRIAPDPSRIGVVVIHGIGSQKPGETLLLWAHSLLRIVNGWAATTPGVVHDNDHALTADIDLTGETRPWVAINVPAPPGEAEAAVDAATVPHPAQTWLLTEAWWAARVTPPSLSEMFRWLVPSGEVGRLISGIFQGVDRQDRTLHAIDTVFLRPFVWLATALAVVLYLVLSLVRLIPYKPLQDFALFTALDAFLIDWFGDLRVLLTDRAQAASIRGRAIDAIRACADEGCASVVVIGHSGGTIVGYTTLTDEALEADLPIRRFITLGQALGIGWRLGHAQDPTVADRLPDHLYQGDRLRRAIEHVRPGVEWHDFWGTHDPAPAGGFANSPSVSKPSLTGGASTMVFNQLSILNDHGAYWDNDEEFLLPVARLVDTAPAKAGASASRFFADDVEPAGAGEAARSARAPARAEARRDRVRALQRSWAMVMLAGALAIPAVIAHSIVVGGSSSFQLAGQGIWSFAVWLGERVGLLLDAFGIGRPSGTADPLLAGLAGAVAMAVAFWAVGEAASRLWADWDARERQIALQPNPSWRPLRQIEGPLWLCGVAALLLLPFAATGAWILAAPSAVLVGIAWLIASRVARGSVANPAT